MKASCWFAGLSLLLTFSVNAQTTTDRGRFPAVMKSGPGEAARYGPPAYRIAVPVVARDTGTGTGTITFGYDTSATYCIDTALGEVGLPPAPPTGVFDVRFVDSRTGPGTCLDQGLWLNLHFWSPAPALDTFRMRFQPSIAGYPIRLSWPAGLGTEFSDLRLVDLFGGILVWVNMLTDTAVSITNAAITDLYILGTSVPSDIKVSPVILVVPDSIDFGKRPLGKASTETFLVKNLGRDALVVSSIASSAPQFTASPSSFSVPALGEQPVVVSFTPADTGSYSGTLTVSSNDSLHPSVGVWVSGRGSYPPAITVSPDSFNVSLNQGDSTTRTLTIGNTGSGDLQWNITLSGGGAMTLKASAIRQPRARTDEETRAVKGSLPQGNNSGPATVSPYSLEQISGGIGTTRILAWVTYADKNPGGEYENTLNAIHQYYTDFIAETTTTVSVTALETLLKDKDIFLMPENEQTTDLSTLGALFGAVLDSFVRSGKTVIVMDYFTSGSTTFLNGTGLMSITNVVNSNSTAQIDSLTDPLVKGLPLTFNALNGSNYHNSPDGRRIVRDVSTGNNRVTAKSLGAGRVIYIGMDFYTYNDDMARLVANAVESAPHFDFISAEPGSGALPPGGSQDVTVKLNAARVGGGTYRADIAVHNNDPLHDPEMVPVRLRVFGRPLVAVEPDSLEFGDGYVGYAKRDTLTVKNNGSDTLTVSGIASSSPEFTASPASFSVPALGEQQVVVSFAPTDTGRYSGTLTVSSNDSAHPSVGVWVGGRGVYSPGITVAQDSFAVSVAEGDSATRTMTIGDTGRGTLSFSITNQLAGSPQAAARTHAGPSGMTPQSIRSAPWVGAIQERGGNRIGPIQYPRTVQITGADSSIRIVTIDLGVAENHLALDLLGFQYVKLSPADFDTVNLFRFDVLYVGWTSGANPAGMQSLYNRRDDIRAFVESGGGLVALSNPDSTRQYSWQWVPAAVTPVYGYGDTVHITQPLHPVMDALDDSALSYWQNSYHNRFAGYDAFLQPLAVGVDKGNQPLTLAGFLGTGRMVLTGQDPDFHYALGGDSGAGILLRNMLRWTGKGGVGWLSENPASGSIAPGATQDVAVKLNARNLSGGDYRAVIVISSNDAQHNPKNVPVRFRVIGKPRIAVVPDSIGFGAVFVGYSRTDTLLVRNTGSDSLMVSSVASDNAVFTVTPASLSVPAHSQRVVLVSFTPPDTLSSAGSLTITSNDSAHLTVSVPLRGQGVFPPGITVNPDSFAVRLNEGDSTKRTMTIGNTGLGQLQWEVQGQGSRTRTVYTLPAARAANADGDVDHRTGKKKLPGTAGSHGPGDQVKAVSASLPDLTGKRIGISDTILYSTIIADLRMRGAQVKAVTFPLPAGLLDSLDVLAAGDEVQAASSSEIAAIRTWVKSGKGLLLQGDDAGTINNNLLLQETGISETTLGLYRDTIFTDIRPHPITAGVDTIEASAYGAYCTVTFPAMTVVYDDLSRPNVAVSMLGMGRVIMSGNEVISSSNLIVGDTRLFSNQIFDWLANLSGFMSVTPSSGVVAPGKSQDVAVAFTAKDLSGGDYNAAIEIRNNDPLHDPKTVPAHLHVVGKPLISVQPDSMQFGEGYIGYVKRDTLTVKNNGSDTLIVYDITSGTSQFTASPASFSVLAHSEQPVVVSFTPADTGRHSGTLTVSSNDSLHPSVGVWVSGRGSYPPAIAVAPDSITVILHMGDSTTTAMKIYNRGLGRLQYQLVAGASPGHMHPAAGLRHGGTAADGPSRSDHPDRSYHAQYVREERNLAGRASSNVLLIEDANPWGTAANESVMVKNGISFDRINSSSIAGTDLTAYPVVIVPSDQSQVLYDAVQANNAKFDAYVTGGGILEFHAAGWGWHSGNPTGIVLPGGMSIMKHSSDSNFVLIPSHPLVKDVPPVFFGSAASHAAFVNIPPGAACIVKDASGNINLVEYYYGMGRVIASGQTLEYGYANGQMAGIILQNLIPYSLSVAGSSFLSMVPDKGTLEPGDSVTIQVTIHGSHLYSGNYTSYIWIKNNDPDHPLVSMPVRVQVLTGVNDVRPGIPAEYALLQNYPNPFNPSTTIRYNLPRQSRVTITVYTALGQEVGRLVDGEQNAGYRSVEWDSKGVASGVYFYRMITTSTNDHGRIFTEVKKMLLIR